MDLGGTPNQAMRRVLLPLLSPAIFASVALVFADTVDDFVTVRYLSAGSTSRAAVDEDLLRGPCLTDAGGERGGNGDADRDPARDRRLRLVRGSQGQELARRGLAS